MAISRFDTYLVRLAAGLCGRAPLCLISCDWIRILEVPLRVPGVSFSQNENVVFAARA
jgi:hypothetical protein